MATYKTPGVYVEEIPKFPPSIAPVETAIPAFIGYTEKAIRNGETLKLKPTRIESIAEYEELFGRGPSQNVEIFLDNDNNFVKAQAESALYLYDSLRMFYANGGGKCYIISVGKYPASNTGIKVGDLEDGLDELEKEDEPTIILLPDAVSIDPDGPYSVQQKALAQCNKLMDRIALCDLIKTTDFTDFDTKVADFRSAIGINALKYGAAYGPWINANLPRQIWRKNLELKREGTGTVVQLESLTTDADISNLIRDIKFAENGGTALTNGITAITGSADKTLSDALQKALDDYRLTTSSSTAGDLTTALQGFTNLTFAVLKMIQAINAASYPAGTQFEITGSITSYLGNPALKNSILELAAHHKKVDTDSTINVINTANPNFDAAVPLLDAAFVNGAALLSSASLPNVDPDYAAVTNDKERADVARDAAYSAALNAITMFNSIQASVSEFEKNLNDTLLAAFGKFKDLVIKGAEALNLLPPSGAIAGVYAAVDRDRGVWKAPANVSLNSVIGPAVKVSHEQQAGYNVDVNAGKSINIIRAFVGKGTLVWGARTLAGNDNEWRYVNVRRFFNFVEESVKKATEQFVFEPNDANTWVKVQAMIENFLTTLWRQGALQGIKPEHAFYVAVGLGKTMTPLDILEGRMIIEIGMAAVRPAEFIILKFSHKMAES
jgi:phage tail sheath protein FI